MNERDKKRTFLLSFFHLHFFLFPPYMIYERRKEKSTDMTQGCVTTPRNTPRNAKGRRRGGGPFSFPFFFYYSPFSSFLSLYLFSFPSPRRRRSKRMKEARGRDFPNTKPKYCDRKKSFPSRIFKISFSKSGRISSVLYSFL